ncbi:uncharacterized protein LOC114303409 isoform X2 [Camellia sinensis]|uniref:uncharacterized protein LOC114303409 isoform X2 n=1 Tax=Camellia sinensis TaxID=4442 RepID=UPI001036BF81|nr:uncharacterized protein LOC114303409 isoform X2 [Camellia sinensis]
MPSLSTIYTTNFLCFHLLRSEFIRQHRRLVSIQNPRLREMAIDRIHSETFPTWFDKHVEELHNAGDSQITEELRCLAHGPNRIFTKYKRYLINGFRFHTKEIERKRKTQNSGIIVTAKTRSFASGRDGNPVSGDVTFYGVLTDIIELDYLFGKMVVLFKGEWVSQSGKRQDKDCTLVNFARLMKDVEPFVLASQAEHVMYVEDLKHKDWQVAIKINPRDFYDMNAGSFVDNVEAYLQSVICNTQSGDGDNNFDLVWTDMSAAIVDAPLSQVLRDNNFHDDGDEEELDLM